MNPAPFTAPTKIAFAITELDVGGAERSLVHLVLGLPRNDWEPRVYCLGAWGPLATTLQEAGIPVRCLNAVHIWDAPLVLWRLSRELRLFQPAILQTFLFHANLLGRIAAAWAGVPHVVSGVRVAERRSRIYGWLDRWTNGLVDFNVCVSRGVADFCERVVGLAPAKIVVIPNGVNFRQFADEAPADPQTVGLPADSRLVLAVGRLEHQKGIDVLIAAIPGILAEEADVQFVVIGDGPDEPALRQLADGLGVLNHLHFLGRRSDVGKWLKRARLLVLPSRWEGMPNVVLESMAAGTPVVAADVEGVAELIRDGETGLTILPENSRALGAAIVRLLRQPEFSSALANAAQANVMKWFTIESSVRQYVDLYRRLAHPAAALLSEIDSAKNS